MSLDTLLKQMSKSLELDYEYLNNEYNKAKKRIKSVRTAKFLKKNALGGNIQTFSLY